MYRSFLRGGSAWLALVAASHTSSAQEMATGVPVQLPHITVGDLKAGGSLTVPSATEQRQTVEKTVGSIGYVDASAPAQKTRVSKDLRDVLEDSPGVFVQSRYGQELRVSVRGSSISRSYHLRGIELLQDGIPVNLADGSGDFYQIDPLAFRAVEVYKGGNALTFGATTLGGAINFISPTAYTADAPNVLRLDGGSFGSVRGSAQISRVIGDWDFLINATIPHADGYRDHSRTNYQQINGNVGYRFSQNAETRFFFGVYNTRQQLPGTLTLDQVFRNPSMASAAASGSGAGGNQARNSLVERIANRTTVAFGAGKVDIDTWFIHKTLNHPIFQVLNQDGFTAGFAPRVTAATELAGHRDEVVAGARAIGGSNAARQFVNVNGAPQAQTLDARQNAVNLEAYAENRFFLLPEVVLMTGAKVFSDRREYRDFGGFAANPRAKYAEITYGGVNPKVGLMWLPRPDVQLFADLSRSRDVPDFSDLTQTTAATTRFVPLKAQGAWTVELGSRGRMDRLNWDVTFYRSDIHNEMLQYTANPSIPASTFNAPHTIHQGIELGVGLDVARGVFRPGGEDAFNVTQIWTFNDFRFAGDPQYAGNRLAGLPTNVLRTIVSYRTNDGFYVAPSLDWVPQGAFVDFANTQRVPGYALLGVQVGATLRPGMTAFLDARNLTNQRYVSDLGTVVDARATTVNTLYPGDGRSFYAGLRYAF